MYNLKFYRQYQSVFSEVEKHAGEWSLVQVQQSIPIFNSIMNLVQRSATIMRAQKQPKVNDDFSNLISERDLEC